MVIGLDVGTTSVRAIAWSVRAERRAEARTGVAIDSDPSGRSTIDPERLFAACLQVRRS